MKKQTVCPAGEEVTASSSQVVAAPVMRVGKNGRDPLRRRLKKYWPIMLFILPAFVLAFVFGYVPYVGILLAFKDKLNIAIYSPIEAFLQAKWTMANFQNLFSDPEFLLALGNTLIISLLKLAIIFPLSILVAISLTEFRFKGYARVIQVVICLPYFLAWSVVVLMFQNILDPINGVVNVLLNAIGVHPVYFFGTPSLFKGLVIFIAGWKTLGWSSIIFIAAISSIDKTFYEAAELDGASKRQQILYLTVPLIMPTIALQLVLNITYLMNAGFEQIYAMINAVTRDVGDVIDTYLYRIALGYGNDYTFATAVGIFSGLVALFLMLGGNAIVKKATGKSIW